MAIRLHGFLSSPKRYIQIESQLYHITGIFQRILNFQHLHGCKFADVHNAYYELEAEGTITFYQAQTDKTSESGIWTYLVFECQAGEEKIYREPAINTSINPLQQLLAGEKLTQVTLDINEYLKYQDNESEYLDIQLPDDWNNELGKEIAKLLLEEVKAFKSSSLFTENIGKEYRQASLDGFIQAAQEILAKKGTLKDFESAQYEVLNKIQTYDIANLIIAYNDYRIWQAALPSKSKAVEFAFNTALSLICRIN
ncbi:hypothetical protein H6G33_06350 [Calothrix sp. FACHB-1219]|uniref:hypothetical protein n=1 Tax=unclassified Calothrix TaxID=2619626 RepID=UPI0016899015|nr:MULTISPECIES: hypothetical protein [unclassified Calothrix]MBD2204473.1 hypothetical protein [Calothrix sp. FACHB-168]MBD2216648.1 hypothetical protein [Calothrix sp. FACHB-1219]